MKRFITLILILMSAVCIFSCSTDSGLAEESYTVEIEIENYGTITAVLDAKTAPITVENFVSLAKKASITAYHFTVSSTAL